jgi:hypothetical protein
MTVSNDRIQAYISKIHEEMKNRGLTEEEIPVVIGRTGFMEAIEQYPEEQLHYDISDAVDEIILTAARR